MATIRFPQFLKKHGVYLLLFANERHKPGLILKRKGDAFKGADKLRKYFRVHNLSWETELVEADMPEVIEGSRKVGAGGKLVLPFLTISAGLESNRFVDFKISAVKQRMFKDDNLWLDNPLSEMLAQLKKDKPRIWKDKLKGRYLVLSTWYASKYEVRLGRALTGDLDARFEQQISPTAGGRMNVDSTNKIVNFFRSTRVPFGFQGKRLVKI
jgi:hypothetical protein